MIILKFLLVSVLMYLGIAAALIILGKPKTFTEQSADNINFNEMLMDYNSLPELQYYQARDNTALAYRHYPSRANKTLILLHGSGWHSQQFLSLANYVSKQGLAQVYTPDLRGHGHDPKRRGDVDYIGQFEDDLADFMAMIKTRHPDTKVIVGGHSSGGGLAIRFAGGQYAGQADAYVLLAPFIYYNAPTTKPNAGGWAQPYTGRIVGLTMLNNMGVHWFDSLTAIQFNLPEPLRNGSETLAYSYRLNTSFAPRDYKQDLSSINQPLLVIAGTADETMYVDQYQPLISEYTKVDVKLLPDVTHMGVVVGPEVQPVLRDWLGKL
ncbi:alpha/beta hydrolase [Motilimonas cestriensis]|nr:alpha/beta fold hydrolase [Motilimonas cestriensis]